jgi:hypothetical protein
MYFQSSGFDFSRITDAQTMGFVELYRDTGVSKYTVSWQRNGDRKALAGD